VDTNASRSRGAPLLVRTTVLAGGPHVAALLGAVPLDPVQVADLMRHHRVVVLSDLTLPPSAPPLAAAAFRLHWPARTAGLAGIGVAAGLRRRGLGRRLLTGALTWLQDDGFGAMLETCGSAGKGAGVKEGVPSRMTES
jgi:GNAT superfamily N-acetyltransferase